MKNNYKQFKIWFAEVNKICASRIGLEVNDLADANWRGMFEDGMTPGMALYEFLFDEGILMQYENLFNDCMEKGEIT